MEHVYTPKAFTLLNNSYLAQTVNGHAKLRYPNREHKCIRKSDGSSQDLTDRKLDCVAVSDKIITMYKELTNLHIKFVLGDLLAKRVITPAEKRVIIHKPEQM